MLHPGGRTEPDGSFTWTEPGAVKADTATLVTIRIDDGSVAITTTYDGHVPYFSWAFDGAIRQAARRNLRHIAERLTAAALGRPEPEPPKRPWWAPPEQLTGVQVRTIASVSLLLAITEYANSLLNQTVDFVATTYHATDAQLGVVTAVTRAGNLVVLVGGVLADRIGRRKLLLWGVGVVMTCTALSALAPSLEMFGALQVVVNGGTNLCFLVGFIAAVEEAPEGSRTYTIALTGIAAGLGFVAGALLLPVADLGPGAWRGLYALAAVGLLFLPAASRSLPETKRFAALLVRHVHGRASEIVDRTYGGRFAVLCLTGFLLNAFFAPQSQFTNRYLGDERGFSGFGILLLRAATQAVPAFAAAYAGGKLAESRGRRPVSRWGLVVGAAATAAFFLGGGPVLWLMLALGTVGLGVAGPSLTAFTTELFPTEVRGTAGAGLTITSVLGSATGLLLAGYLADPLGSIGRSVAVTAIGPVIVAVFLIRFLPEARGRLLDDVSPPEV